MSAAQDKQKEIDFFDGHAAADSYDVFTPESNARLIDTIVRHGKFAAGSKVADLGCGSGVFTDLLRQRGCVCSGIDLSPKLIELALAKYPGVEFLEGDVEHLPFADASFDGILLSGLVHHLPDPHACAAEAYRVLKPGGRFVAFDPNRMNPFMYLYRDRSSPFYSPVGVTPNERPVIAKHIAATFESVGFEVGTDYLSSLHYRYIASSKARWLLPAYNLIDDIVFSPGFMKPLRSFVITYGRKPG
jgi:ubiquinone/menaquinone biosynthesis C-methylase UbiE